MRTQPTLAIRVAAAALALSACGIATGIPGGTSVVHAAVVSARPAPGDNRIAELRELDQVKRAVAWAAVERAWARQAQAGAARLADLRALAQVKRDAAWAAVERARGA
jgi:hypothetical protein